MGRFTKIPENTFDALQLDAGILLNKFDPENPDVQDEDIITATTGGINPTCVPTYSDFGEDVDNVPNNMMEFKHLDGWDCKIATTGLGTSVELIHMALGAADIDGNKVTPRRDIKLTDFKDLWWVGDKANGGFVAIRLMNALSTGGFSLQTTKNGKGQVSIEITGHVSIKAQDVIPMEFYSADADPFTRVVVEPEAQTATLFETSVSDIQAADVKVTGNKITGTLKYLSEGPIADYWGAGNFLALKFSNLDSNATSVKVGLNPSQGSGPAEIINDPDKNGVCKITSTTQKFEVVTTDGEKTMKQIYDLSGLTLLAEV